MCNKKKCTLNTRLCIPRYFLANWISLQQVLQTMYVCLEKQKEKKKVWQVVMLVKSLSGEY